MADHKKSVHCLISRTVKILGTIDHEHGTNALQNEQAHQTAR